MSGHHAQAHSLYDTQYVAGHLNSVHPPMSSGYQFSFFKNWSHDNVDTLIESSDQYRTGTGDSPVDLVMAYFLLNLACRLDSVKARHKRKLLSAEMSLADIIQAQSLAREVLLSNGLLH